MKKLFFMLIVLFIFYLGIQFIFYWLSNGQEINYRIKDGNNNFDVVEKSNFSNHNYFYNVTINDTKFSFQVFKDYGKENRVLTDVKYYEDDIYKCILPIFDGEILIDMICKSDTYQYYHNIKGNDNLDEFVNSIEIYDANQFIDNTEAQEIENVLVYRDNLIDNHYVGINNYKGIYNISKNFNSVVYNITLFQNDVYNQKLGTFIGKYYIVADYNEKHEFNKINIVDLVNLNASTITSNTAISFDSYIQGIIDNKVYLYDKDNKVQYEIDPNNKSIVKTGTEIKYNDGEWKTMTVAEANQEKKFVSDENYGYENYDRVDKVGEGTGFYYLYKKNGNSYDVYRTNIQDNEGMVYLFTTQSIDLISYVNNYVYFIEDNKIKVYNDAIGVKNIVDYKELEFNKNINFYVFAN